MEASFGPMFSRRDLLSVLTENQAFQRQRLLLNKTLKRALGAAFVLRTVLLRPKLKQKTRIRFLRKYLIRWKSDNAASYLPKPEVMLPALVAHLTEEEILDTVEAMVRAKHLAAWGSEEGRVYSLTREVL